MTSEKTNTYTGSGGDLEEGFFAGKGILPTVVGASYDEAVEILSSSGFKKVTRSNVVIDDPSKDGLVFEQTPTPKLFTPFSYGTEVILGVYTYGGE